jgi:FdhD protein
MPTEPQTGTTTAKSAAADPRALMLAPERAVDLEVNGVRVATLMCTPYDLDALAIGHLASTGLIASLDEVLSLHICPDNSRVSLRCARDPVPAAPVAVTSSACGASAVSLFGVERAPSLPLGATFPLESIRDRAREMFDRAVMHKTIGGMHCAALANRDGLICVFEDVGRHNAIDKAIGRGLVDRVDFARCCILSSGRIATDMAAKAIMVGVPVIVTRSIPTTSAHAMAVDKGLTMIGRVVSSSPIVYTMRERIV